MEHFDKIPEIALGAGMVTAIGYILLQLIRSYGNLGSKWKDYAEEMERELAKEKRRNRRRK